LTACFRCTFLYPFDVSPPCSLVAKLFVFPPDHFFPIFLVPLPFLRHPFFLDQVTFSADWRGPAALSTSFSCSFLPLGPVFLSLIDLLFNLFSVPPPFPSVRIYGRPLKGVRQDISFGFVPDFTSPRPFICWPPFPLSSTRGPSPPFLAVPRLARSSFHSHHGFQAPTKNFS